MRECREHGRQIAKQWALQPLTTVASLANTRLNTEPKSAAQTAKPVSVNAEEVVLAEHSADCQCMICTVCNWVYDPAKGEPNQEIEAGTTWADVPEYFLCPECNLGKDVFVEHNG